MKPNGRRAWRKWLNRRRRNFYKMARLLPKRERTNGEPTTRQQAWIYRGPVKKRARKGLTGAGPRISTPKLFTARSLVGMTMGARKRLYQRIVDAFPTEGDAFLIDTEGKGVPIGWLLSQRLRPCPGCPKCGVLRFRRIGGFGDNTACVEHRLSTGQSRLIRSIGIPWRYSRDRRRSKSAPFHPLDRCVELVDAGQWTLDPELCDGSGVLPARKAKR